MTTEAKIQTLRREPLEFGHPDRPKEMFRLASSDLLVLDLAIVHEGGKNDLHSHSGLDEAWFVLSGRARFYGQGDRVVAELGPKEGLMIPRGVPYWFESASTEPLEILRFAASDPRVKNEHVYHS